MSVTTLEEVFIKVANGTNTQAEALLGKEKGEDSFHRLHISEIYIGSPPLLD
jgi:hypothetical protein